MWNILFFCVWAFFYLLKGFGWCFEPARVGQNILFKNVWITNVEDLVFSNDLGCQHSLGLSCDMSLYIGSWLGSLLESCYHLLVICGYWSVQLLWTCLSWLGRTPQKFTLNRGEWPRFSTFIGSFLWHVHAYWLMIGKSGGALI